MLVLSVKLGPLNEPFDSGVKVRERFGALKILYWSAAGKGAHLSDFWALVTDKERVGGTSAAWSGIGGRQNMLARVRKTDPNLFSNRRGGMPYTIAGIVPVAKDY